MLKQELQQKLQQKLSPAQIQVIKMLEIPTLELEERIRQELEENPALEEGADQTDMADKDDDDDVVLDEGGNNDDFDAEEYMMDDDIPDYKLNINNTSRDERQQEIPISASMSFHDFLLEQIGLLTLTEKQRMLVEYVIGNIDEEGYLRRTPEAMVDDIVFHSGMVTTDNEMFEIVKLVQSLDPPGVGAVSLQNCLLLQLERHEHTEVISLAKLIITQFFDEFSRKHYDKIQKTLDLSDELLKNAISEIIHLNPKPGNTWGGNYLEGTLAAIVPDFIVENNDGQLTVALNNSNIPELHVSSTYNDMFHEYAVNKKNQTREHKDAVLFVKQKIDSARWFIDAIRQRQQTMLATISTIVELQRDFFIEGDEVYLKPMILKDIAIRIGYDVSTISRVTNNKYVQTEFGIFPLRFFFSEGVINDSGEEISTREIKKLILECVANEDKLNPLNDDGISDYLKERGYMIARRTIAKYRELLDIPVSRLRRKM